MRLEDCRPEGLQIWFLSTAPPRKARHNMLTARAANNASVVSDIVDCTIIIPFAHRDRTGTSVGEKAVLVLNARNR